MMISTRTIALLVSVALFARGPMDARAAAPLSPSADLDAALAGLDTGDQLPVSGRSGDVAFGGQRVVLTGFSGLFGYASEVAYVLIVEGEARIGDKVARRGHALMIGPLGTGIAAARYDAGRLHQALGAKGDDVPFLAALGTLAAGQRRGIFWGRLGRTNFNIATMNSARAESDRRSRLGGAAIRDARFTAQEPGDGFERDVVNRFLAALARGDATDAAQFLDPLPYGFNRLDAGGDKARRVMAERLIARQDWAALAAVTPDKKDEARWTVAAGSRRAEILLRRTSEFAFVQSIQLGDER